jgi:hypothetical protein
VQLLFVLVPDGRREKKRFTEKLDTNGKKGVRETRSRRYLPYISQ